MGKASSSKKVARAAKAAGRPGAGRSYAWPALLGGLVVLGLVLIVFSRGKTEDAVAPKLGDHWHAAYGIYVCDSFQGPLNDVIADESGLHSHGDGLMHMHPFGTKYTGDGANIGNFGETVGLEVTDTSFKVGSSEYENGDECEDAGDSQVYLKVWDGPDDTEGRLIESDLADYAPQEFSMWVLAFVPEGTEIPPPPQEYIDALRSPSDVPGGSTPPPSQTIPADPGTTLPGSTETTAPGTESTAPPDTTATTAPPDTTATSAP